MDPQNLMSTLQQLSNLSNANLTSQMNLNQFGNDLSSFPWAANSQSWLDSAKMAAMYNSIIQTASVNDQVQQSLNNINAMSSIEQSLKILAQQTSTSALPQSQSNIDQLATAQSNLQNRLAMETMLQNDALSSFLQSNLQQQQQQVSSTSTKEAPPSIDTNLAQSLLLQLPQNTSTAEFLTNNLQNILGLSNNTPTTSSSLSQNTEQQIFNAAANHLNNLQQGQVDQLQELYAKQTKKQSKDQKRPSVDLTQQQQPTTSQLTNINDTANHAILLSRISQNNLLAANPIVEHNYQPSTSSNITQPTTTSKPSNGLTIDDFDLNDLHEIFSSDKKQPKPTQAPQTTTAVENQQTQKPHNESSSTMDLDHFDFDFNEAAHIEKSFDPLKFLNEMTGGTARDSPEPGFNQAELEPVQFTPPDSPTLHHQQQSSIKIENLASHIPTNAVLPKTTSTLLAKPIEELQKPSTNSLSLISNIPSTNQPDTKNDLLMFIPTIKENAQLKKTNDQPTRKSTLLQRSSNKVPIYKQKFISLKTQPSSETKTEDCYSFVDDEFELPTTPPKTSTTTSAQKEQEPTVKVVEKADKQHTSTMSTTSRRVNQAKEHHHRETKTYVGTPWTKEYLERMENQQTWICVNPFECTDDLIIDEPSPDLTWTADRSAFKKNSLRVVIKEEPPVVNDASEEAPRPRLVLKFIKPKADEIANEDLEIPTSNHKHKHSKKHKKHHKKRERDTDWEYPGEVKKHKKDKKHRHKHRHHHHKVKLEEVDEYDESHPAHNTRSILSIKTENLDYSSPSHSNHSFASASSTTIPHKTSTSNDNILLVGSRLMDDQFLARYRSFEQTQNDLQKGVFVVAKEDLWKEECPIWRIDSQNLLQKFVPCDENPGCYTNTSNYNGYCDELSEQYVVIHVEILKQSRAETIVKPLHSLDTLFPAIPIEDPSICCFEENQKVAEDVETKSGLFLMVESVVELLMKQCADPNTLERICEMPDSKTTQALNEFKQRCNNCIEEIQIEEMIRMDLKILLDHYNGFITFENHSDGEECLVCGQNEQLIRIGLHGDEIYDSNFLTIHGSSEEKGFPHSMDISACQQCAILLQFYHQNRHALLHLFKKCEDQFINLALERPTATSNALLNLALKNKAFMQTTANDILNLWDQLATFMEQDSQTETT